MLKSLVSWWSHSSKIPTLHLDCTIAIGGGVWVGMEWTMPSHESFQQVSCAGLRTDSTNHSQRTIHFHKKFEKMKHHKNNIKSFLTKKAPTYGWWWLMSIKKQHIFVQLLVKLKWFYDYRPPSMNMHFLVRKYSICPRMKCQFGTASSLNSRENWFAVKSQSASLSYCFGLNNNDDFWQLWVDYHRESRGPSQ